MLTETTDYAKLYRDFRWDVPARFNIATACCDRHADGTARPALIYVDEDGGAQRTSFDQMQEMSRRFANVLKADGLVRGARVAVFLSQSMELPIVHLAAFRSGLVSIRRHLVVFGIPAMGPFHVSGRNLAVVSNQHPIMARHSV